MAIYWSQDRHGGGASTLPRKGLHIFHPEGVTANTPVRGVRVRVCKCVCDASFKMPAVMALLCALLVSVLLEKLKL